MKMTSNLVTVMSAQYSWKHRTPCQLKLYPPLIQRANHYGVK